MSTTVTEFKKRRRAILTSVLLDKSKERGGLIEILTRANLIVRTGTILKPEYDWYFMGYATLAHREKE